MDQSPYACLNPKDNLLLAALPAAMYEALKVNLALLPLPAGSTVYEAGQRLSQVYFFTEGVVSVHYEMEGGTSSELALIGREGMVGVHVLMGADKAYGRAVVQCAGHAWGVDSDVLRAEFERDSTLRGVLLRYIQVLLTQMAQAAICNGHHAVEQRLCRRLLMVQDRVKSCEMNMTHELVAHMLGVSRKAVTVAAGKLQDEGLIRYARGRVAVLDRPGLEARACECYMVFKGETERLFPLQE